MEQINIAEVLQKAQRPPRPDPANPITLPGFAEAKAHLQSKGLPWEWITEVVNTTSKHAIHLKNGRPFYKSDCPRYKGYWLYGGIGAVDCSACDRPLPGLMWDTTCKGEFTSCPFFGKEETNGQNHQRDPAPEL